MQLCIIIILTNVILNKIYFMHFQIKNDFILLYYVIFSKNKPKWLQKIEKI
jgi:hypothetical protein